MHGISPHRFLLGTPSSRMVEPCSEGCRGERQMIDQHRSGWNPRKLETSGAGEKDWKDRVLNSASYLHTSSFLSLES